MIYAFSLKVDTQNPLDRVKEDPKLHILYHIYLYIKWYVNKFACEKQRKHQAWQWEEQWGTDPSGSWNIQRKTEFDSKIKLLKDFLK